jgi:hypothetical protein
LRAGNSSCLPTTLCKSYGDLSKLKEDERKRTFKSRYDQEVFLNTFELGAGDALKRLSAQDMTTILRKCSVVNFKDVLKSTKAPE